MNAHPELIVKSLLYKLGISVSARLINRQIKTHPDYPSLLSITDTLDYLSIENAAGEIDKTMLHDISTPFIAHLKDNGDEFVIVENRDTLENLYPDFFQKWSGIVVAIEKTPSWQHKENEDFLKQDRKNANVKKISTALLLITIIAAMALAPDWSIALLIAIGAIGVFISWLIVSKDLGIENKIADQVCGKESDCNSIIKAKGAKLPLGITWSDIGITWFSSLLVVSILSVFTGTASVITHLFSVLTTGVIPFALFSIYYQGRIAKKWCKLCLITVGLLILQSALLLPYLLNNSWQTTTLNQGFFFSTVALIASIILASFKQGYKKNKELEEEVLRGIRFKRNESVFSALLENQRSVNVLPWKDDLQLGNPDASLQITVACNPYCVPCATIHHKLHGLLEKFENKIGLTIRFTLKTSNKEDNRTKAVQYLLGLIEQQTIDMNPMERSLFCREVLHQWFLLMNMKRFSEVFNYHGSINVDDLLRRHEAWITKSNITFTPTIFFNGFEMPSSYNIDDLALLISPLAETYSQNGLVYNNEPIFI